MDIEFNTFFLKFIEDYFSLPIHRFHDNNMLFCDCVHVPSLLFGNRLISGAYLTDGGIYGDATYHQKQMIHNIIELAKNKKVDYIEFRGGIRPDYPKIIIKKEIYASFVKYFSPEENVLLSIPRKKRADIRKALDNSQLSFCQNVNVKDFYRLFARSQHKHGTPAHHFDYFKKLSENQKFIKIDGVYYSNTLVASCMSFIWDNQLVAYYGAADADYVGLHVYDLMYYHLMRIAQEKGKKFNFGRSKYNTGSFKYKTLWGFEPIETEHYMIPIGKKKIPDIRANNPEFSRKIELWKKLPEWLAHYLGAKILKQIG